MYLGFNSFVEFHCIYVIIKNVILEEKKKNQIYVVKYQQA